MWKEQNKYALINEHCDGVYSKPGIEQATETAKSQ